MRFLAMAQVGLEPSHTAGCRRGTKVQNRTVGIGHERFRNEAIRDNSRSRRNFTGPNRENTLILIIKPTTDNSKEPQAFSFGSVRLCSVPLELHRTEPQECARVSNQSAVLSEPVKNPTCAHIYCTINSCQVRYTRYVSPLYGRLGRLFNINSGNPRMLPPLVVLVREFESRRGETWNLFAKMKKGSTIC